MKNKILEKLQNSDGYVSGQELCELLGVSRTAVWKNIQALKNEGYVIEGVNNKGYRLVSEPDVMSEEKISKYLETRTFARKLYISLFAYSVFTCYHHISDNTYQNYSYETHYLKILIVFDLLIPFLPLIYSHSPVSISPQIYPHTEKKQHIHAASSSCVIN